MDWKVVKEIVDTFENVRYEEDMYEQEWLMDEDQTGIPYPNKMSRNDMFKLVARIYNITHKEE